MPTLGATWPTLLDVASRLDPQGRIPMIAEVLNKVNPILMDMPFKEGNLPTGHKDIIRTGLPTVAWRKLNYGTLPSKSTTAPVVDTCGKMEAFSEIDEELYKLNGASDAFRFSEDKAHIESMSQEAATTLFYGDTDVDPDKFLGLSARFNDPSAVNGSQLVNGGGSQSDNTSIWVVGWGPETICGIYPKGSKAGLKYENLGKDTKRDSSGRMMRVLVSHLLWDIGLSMKDWGSTVRVCNIDVSDLAAAGQSGYSGADLVNLLIEALGRIPTRLENTGRFGIYMNKTCWTAYAKLAIDKVAGSTLTIDDFEDGKPLMKFWGHPIRKCDAILNTEAAISFA